ncbi:dynein light chain roadblock-type 2-like [Episyrphus balteatus]|uniref:dynein light chain roadblock-type 2-like n=1 Tax=Episyrphus balteatus TaxID=286459 RepID=UPI002486871A|nr:dynein light chain roadblock-type 2-like [Episyrphus balteatus]
MSTLEEIIHKNESTSDRIAEQSQGYAVISNHNAMAMKSTLEKSMTQGIIKHIAGPLVFSARSAVRDLDATNDLTFLRVATKKYEFLIAPEDEFTLVVLQ